MARYQCIFKYVATSFPMYVYVMYVLFCNKCTFVSTPAWAENMHHNWNKLHCRCPVILNLCHNRFYWQRHSSLFYFIITFQLYHFFTRRNVYVYIPTVVHILLKSIWFIQKLNIPSNWNNKTSTTNTLQCFSNSFVFLKHKRSW